ncbi:hypothetical protein SAMN04488156_102875 [Bacillus sp. 166amftsu]|nr:hypothetical protein SAMN04488156_102875 [Bacillus sp. 166amftsu]
MIGFRDEINQSILEGHIFFIKRQEGEKDGAVL